MLRVSLGCTAGPLSWLLLSLSLLLTCLASATSASEDEQCEGPSAGSTTVPASNLLQIAKDSTDGREDIFGPGGCVGLKRSVAGSCVFRTRCEGQNISDTEFAFICFNPGQTMPHALHSFGRGGFALQETLDTKVRCKTCMSVDTAFRTGESVVKNALAALPLSRLPSLNQAVNRETAYSPAELGQFKPQEAAVFGPNYCISTFRAPAGTCLIRTKCIGENLAKFNVGVTCLDKSGGYTRYLFGKDSFKAQETFDTLIACDRCLGVGPESSVFALHGLMPRKLVDDVSTLKTDLQTLTQKVRVLQDYDLARRNPYRAMPPSNRHLTNEGDPLGSTVMMARRQTAASELYSGGSLPSASVVQGSDQVAQDAGAETASMNLGEVQLVSHRRGAAIAELLRRVSEE